jgi:serine/threonine protein kinase
MIGDQLEAGDQVEQYLIQRQLGNGAMGSIYLALDTGLDRSAALKFVLSNFNDHPGMRRRFEEEAKVLASLNRPNIPVLYEYFIWRNRGVMAMEYVDGETFENMVMRRGPIPANVCVPLVKQALQGLGAAHRRGVVHRDLKPGNLMINGEGTVKVVDFGIAKKLEVETKLTATNTTVGTPMYMAPEQIMGKPVDARTDIYSMGVVLYELLAGQVPFNADSLYEIQAAHVQKTPEPPTIHYPHIPKPVVDAVMKALQKSPADRFASAEEFSRALPNLEAPPDYDAQDLARKTDEIVEPAPAPTPTPRPTPIPVPSPAPDFSSKKRSGEQVVEPPPPSPTPARRASSVIERPPVVEPHPPAGDRTSTHKTIAHHEEPIRDEHEGGRNKALIAGLAVCLALILSLGAWFMFKPAGEKAQLVAIPSSTPVDNSRAETRELNTEPPPESNPPITVPAPKPEETKPSQHHPTQPSGGDSSAAGNDTRETKPQPPPVKPAAAATDLSGDWRGFYFNQTSQERTMVHLSMQQAGTGRISGSLNFQTASASGQCDLNGSSYSGGKLQLILTHCSPTEAYFNTPTVFLGVDPTAKLLSGGRVFNAPSIAVSLQRE